MSDNLLPCLKEHNWPGREHTICRVLWAEEASQYMPWLAFGWDHPHTFEFINTDKSKGLGLTDEALEAQALANLRGRSGSWQPIDSDAGDGKQLKMLICTDDFFAAERIADATFMQEAQRRLGSSGLLVGIPRRGLMMATRVDQDEQLIMAFGGVVAGEFSRGESAVISPMIFALKDGAIVALVEAMADAMGDQDAGDDSGDDADDDDDDDDDEAEDDPLAPYVSAIVARNKQGTQDVHIMAGGQDGDRLVRGIEDAFHQLLKEHLNNKEFGGYFRIIVFGFTPVAAREGLPGMVEHLRGIVSDMQGHGVPPMRIELEIQQDDPFAAKPDAAPAGSSRPATARRRQRPQRDGAQDSGSWSPSLPRRCSTRFWAVN